MRVNSRMAMAIFAMVSGKGVSDPLPHDLRLARFQAHGVDNDDTTVPACGVNRDRGIAMLQYPA